MHNVLQMSRLQILWFDRAALVRSCPLDSAIEYAIDLARQIAQGVGRRHHLLRSHVVLDLTGYNQGLFCGFLGFLLGHGIYLQKTKQDEQNDKNK